MNEEQIRARLEEIAKLLDGIKAGKDGFTKEQVEQVNALNDEFENLNTQLETIQKVANLREKATGSTGRKTTSDQPSTSKITYVGSQSDKFGGFPSGSEWIKAVKTAGMGGKVDERLYNLDPASEKSGEEGGFLVPEEMSAGILKRLEADDSLMARTKQFSISGNNLSINVDQNTPWSGGVTAYWTEEAGTITESKPSFRQSSWRLNKLAALVKATDELLDDTVALESYIKNAAPEAILHQVNKAIIDGNGTGKPHGIIGSGFTVSVAKESGQSADTVEAANIVKMYSRMFPNSRSNAVWLINAQLEDQLRLMKDDNENYIYLSPGSQMNQTPYGSLLGRPVIPLMAGIPALGDTGDIIFADLSYYYMIKKAAGIKSATSIHLHFDRDITSFKFTMRLDGKCPFNSPVTTEYGSYNMSAFVKLDAR